MPFQRRPRRKAARKPAASGRRRRPAAGARKSRPVRRARNVRSSNAVIRQQNLGQQTENTVSFKRGRSDSRAKMMKAVSTTNQWVYQASDKITTAGVSGRQAWNYTDIAVQSDLQNIGDLLAPRGAGSQTPPARYLLQKCQHNIKFSNLGQANVKLIVLHVRAKRDLYTNNNYTSPSGFVYNWQGTPVQAVQQGIAAAAQQPTTSSTAYLIPGMDESESPLFNSYFSVVKKTEVLLAVGGTHKITTNVSYDRVLDASVYCNTEMTGILGITDFLLMKAEGQTGVSTDGPSLITVAPCQIGYTENYDYTFSQVVGAKKFLDFTDEITAAVQPVSVISGSTGSGVTATGLIA